MFWMGELGLEGEVLWHPGLEEVIEERVGVRAVLSGLAGQVLPPWRKSSAGGNRTCIRRANPRQRYHAAPDDNDMTLCLSSTHAIPVSNW